MRLHARGRSESDEIGARDRMPLAGAPMMAALPAARRIVLVGGGHAHVGVLHAFGMRPEPGFELVLIAKELDAPYSGMLPGFIAGHYSLDECHIDLVRLAHFAGARVIHGEAVGIDARSRQVALRGRPSIAYDVVSIDTGITPLMDDIEGAVAHAIAVKPVSTFAPRWEALAARALAPDGPRRITVVGTGAAGFEIVLAIRQYLRSQAKVHSISPEDFRFTLIGSGELLTTHPARARRLAAAALAEAGVVHIANDAAVTVGPDRVILASGRTLPSDATLVTTRAAAPAWFKASGLAVDARGFLEVRPTLQMLGDDDIFAVGDCAAVVEHPREKAGVFAVRQAPPLTENLRLRVRGLPTRPFTPQRQFLTLLSCGGRTAIASRGGLAAAGAWAWQLKDRIDRRFMERFNKLPLPMSGMAEDMLCAGCAAKIGPATLTGALDRLDAIAPPLANSVTEAGLSPAAVIRNLAPRDDAAVLDLGPGPLRLETIDAFPAIWPEPYVLGEIAAAHALSDILAKGGTPDHALALVGLPSSGSRLAEDDLFQVLAGARAVLDPAGATLVGGHTLRADALSAGFFVSGTVARDRLLAKSSLADGDTLVITKPLGTGVLFAAWMRREARAREVAAALAGMRRTNADAARILMAHGASAATDITGFGLAGHLLEMLAASGTEARIGLSACPRYPGVDRLIAAGIRSSLLPENLSLAGRLQLNVAPADQALALLFDPQTSGGLVAGIPTGKAAACLAAFAASGLVAAAIGIVGRRGEAGRLIVEPELAVALEAVRPGRSPPDVPLHTTIKTT